MVKVRGDGQRLEGVDYGLESFFVAYVLAYFATYAITTLKLTPGIAFGATAPTGAQDGAKLREESQMICESGQVLWFRAAVGRASVYRGEFK